MHGEEPCLMLCSILTVRCYSWLQPPFSKAKSQFLVVQLLPEFDFGHATPKPGILDHRTIKTVHI